MFILYTYNTVLYRVFSSNIHRLEWISLTVYSTRRFSCVGTRQCVCLPSTPGKKRNISKPYCVKTKFLQSLQILYCRGRATSKNLIAFKLIRWVKFNSFLMMVHSTSTLISFELLSIRVFATLHTVLSHHHKPVHF